MKITNKNSIYLYVKIATVNMIIVFSATVLLWAFTKNHFINSIFFRGIVFCCCIIVLFIFNFIKRHTFQYENVEGILTFKNENFLKFIDWETDRFSKYQLIDFEIKEAGINKKLYIKQHQKKITLVYNITFLSDAEVQNLTEDFKSIILKNCFYLQKQFTPVG
ncbi:hypothetical protein [Chryseobacterium sp. SIMBA_038]|uniref:hypothetical protein n=1 Tax=Chryseobacterium sp. SIMBA_038 TaxID=3085780 RepID=UPI00397E87B1